MIYFSFLTSQPTNQIPSWKVNSDKFNDIFVCLPVYLVSLTHSSPPSSLRVYQLTRIALLMATRSLKNSRAIAMSTRNSHSSTRIPLPPSWSIWVSPANSSTAIPSKSSATATTTAVWRIRFESFSAKYAQRRLFPAHQLETLRHQAHSLFLPMLQAMHSSNSSAAQVSRITSIDTLASHLTALREHRHRFRRSALVTTTIDRCSITFKQANNLYDFLSSTPFNFNLSLFIPFSLSLSPINWFTIGTREKSMGDDVFLHCLFPFNLAINHAHRNDIDRLDDTWQNSTAYTLQSFRNCFFISSNLPDLRG